MNITNTTKSSACDYKTETVAHFIRATALRIVEYTLKTKKCLTLEGKDQSGLLSLREI